MNAIVNFVMITKIIVIKIVFHGRPTSDKWFIARLPIPRVLIYQFSTACGPHHRTWTNSTRFALSILHCMWASLYDIQLKCLSALIGVLLFLEVGHFRLSKFIDTYNGFIIIIIIIN